MTLELKAFLKENMNLIDQSEFQTLFSLVTKSISFKSSLELLEVLNSAKIDIINGKLENPNRQYFLAYAYKNAFASKNLEIGIKELDANGAPILNTYYDITMRNRILFNNFNEGIAFILGNNVQHAFLVPADSIQFSHMKKYSWVPYKISGYNCLVTQQLLDKLFKN